MFSIKEREAEGSKGTKTKSSEEGMKSERKTRSYLLLTTALIPLVAVLSGKSVALYKAS